MDGAGGSAEVLIDTYREGVLALVGHDLRLSVERFELRAAAGALSGSLELGSLVVLGSVRKGRLDARAPAPSERAEIEQRIRDLLQVEREPRARLEGQVARRGDGFEVAGTLRLCGRAEPITASLARAGEALEASVQLTPSRFGIAPFQAFGGALRVADRVTVRVRLPLAAAAPGHDLAALTACWQRPSR